MVATVDTNAKLLVTGASGRLGLLVVKHLLDTLKIKPSNIIAGSRNPDKLKAFAERGVTTVRLDFSDAHSVQEAATGVDRALVISGVDLLKAVDNHKTAISALIATGVKHILYTALHNVDTSNAFVMTIHRATEQFLRESNIAGYTLLRNGMYFENDIELGAIPSAKHTGKRHTATKNCKIAGISRDDLALADAMVLASDNYDNQIYNLSGTTGLTVDEVVANVSKAIGVHIDVVQISVDELAERYASLGMPEAVAKAIATFDRATAEGHADSPTDDFKALVGRDPVSHVEWLKSIAPLLNSF